MSDEKKLRPVAEIQAEYQNLCTKAGHTQYQIITLSKDLDLLNETLRNLNLEAAAAYKAEKEVSDKAAQEAPKNE